MFIDLDSYGNGNDEARFNFALDCYALWAEDPKEPEIQIDCGINRICTISTTISNGNSIEQHYTVPENIDLSSFIEGVRDGLWRCWQGQHNKRIERMTPENMPN